MKQQIIDWFNNNAGLVAVLIFVAGIILAIFWHFIKHFFFRDRSGKNLTQRQKSGDSSTNLQSGRDINIP